MKTVYCSCSSNNGEIYIDILFFSPYFVFRRKLTCWHRLWLTFFFSISLSFLFPEEAKALCPWEAIYWWGHGSWNKTRGHSQHHREDSRRSTAVQRSAIYPNLTEFSNLVVECEGHSANAVKFGNQVSLCACIIHSLRAYIFYCRGHHQPGAVLSVTWESRHVGFPKEELLSETSERFEGP